MLATRALAFASTEEAATIECNEKQQQQVAFETRVNRQHGRRHVSQPASQSVSQSVCPLQIRLRMVQHR